MKTVNEVLGVARSNLHVRARRSVDWTDGRRHRQPRDDAALVAEIKAEIAPLPSYGYRRAWTMVNRRRDRDGPTAGQPQARLPRHARPSPAAAPAHRSTGGYAQPRRTDRSQPERSALVLGWLRDRLRQPRTGADCLYSGLLRSGSDELVATTGGVTGEMVRDLMVEAVEMRFGTATPTPPIEWLTDNGSPYIARDTRSFAREIGLDPLTTAIESPQSNGMAEAFVKTFKRDYADRMDCRDDIHRAAPT